MLHTIYSNYILSGFCHLLCNPVDILLSCCTLQHINKLLPCLFLCHSISSCLFILIPITCCFGFIPYLIASSFLLNSFSYLIISPPCFTMPRWSIFPPTYLFCCLVLYLFHCTPFAFYIVSFKYLIFSICYQPIKFLFYSDLPNTDLPTLTYHTQHWTYPHIHLPTLDLGSASRTFNSWPVHL